MRALFLLTPLLLLAALCGPLQAQQGALRDKGSDKALEPPKLLQILTPWTGDLPEMKENRRVRALVVFNRTTFFINSRGEPSGIMEDLCDDYNHELNRGRGKREPAIGITFMPVLFEDLIQNLLDGKGDFIAHTLTITPEREKLVDFTAPLLTDVREVLVTRKGLPRLGRMEDFSGREIHVTRGSSHEEHLKALNLQFARRELPPVRIIEAGPTQGSEHLLEMLSAGIIDNVVCDDYIARLWTRVFKNLVVDEAFPLSAGGSIAWAVRKNNPLLLASLNQAIAKMTKKPKSFEQRFANYYKGTRWLDNPFLSKDKRPLVDHFRNFAETYRFDWLQCLAQAFQESGLDNSARSPMGAVGIMQVLPSTGRDLGFKDVSSLTNNIHAGIKYMSQMRVLFDGEGVTPENRFLFALAAYNAGPNRVKKLRELTAQAGFDPNVWFNNVERMALRTVGQETVNYVRNINNYFIAYRLSLDIHLKREEATRAAGNATTPTAATPPAKSKAKSKAKP